MELKERLEFGFLVGVLLVGAEYCIENFGYGPCNWGWALLSYEVLTGGEG